MTSQAWSNLYGAQGSVRNIKRTKYSSQSLPGLQIVWEWMTDIGWVMFHIPTATEIEEAFQNGENEMDLEDTPLGIPNLISFLGMWQKNKWSGYIRPIQRRELDVGYMTDKPLANKPKAGKGKSRSPPKLSAPSGSSHQAQKNSSVVNEKKKIGKRGFKPQSRNNEMIKHPVLNQFCVIVNESVEEDCPICMDSLDEDSDMYHGGNHILELKSCHHKFHDSCLEACYENGNKDGSLQCPICKTIHGIKHGMQPPGTMTVTKINRSLPGHQGCGTIQITYMISSGIQGPNHRNPGQPYVAYGFPRIGYLPDNPKGRKVLNLLRKAWDRKLIFTIDQSVTTGVQNAVVWNEIHHKTEAYSNHSGHGYPDPNYLDNVLMELKAQGVRDSDDETS